MKTYVKLGEKYNFFEIKIPRKMKIIIFYEKKNHNYIFPFMEK